MRILIIIVCVAWISFIPAQNNESYLVAGGRPAAPTPPAAPIVIEPGTPPVTLPEQANGNKTNTPTSMNSSYNLHYLLNDPTKKQGSNRYLDQIEIKKNLIIVKIIDLQNLPLTIKNPEGLNHFNVGIQIAGGNSFVKKTKAKSHNYQLMSDIEKIIEINYETFDHQKLNYEVDINKDNDAIEIFALDNLSMQYCMNNTNESLRAILLKLSKHGLSIENLKHIYMSHEMFEVNIEIQKLNITQEQY